MVSVRNKSGAFATIRNLAPAVKGRTVQAGLFMSQARREMDYATTCDVVALCNSTLHMLTRHLPEEAGQHNRSSAKTERPPNLDLHNRISSQISTYISHGASADLATSLNADYVALLRDAASKMQDSFVDSFQDVKGGRLQKTHTREAIAHGYCREFENLMSETSDLHVRAIKHALPPTCIVQCEPTAVLETAYSHCTHPTPAEKERLARACGLTARQVNTWVRSVPLRPLEPFVSD